MAEHQLHTKWKNLKKKYQAELKKAKLNFDKGLGPKLDIIASKPNTKEASLAALKVKQWALDYRGSKYLSGSDLDNKIKEELIGVLVEIDKVAMNTPQVK